MKAVLFSLHLLCLTAATAIAQDNSVRNLTIPGPAKQASDCAVTWCSECEGEVSLDCIEGLDGKMNLSTLKFNVIAKKMPQDEVAFFYRQTENEQFTGAIIPRIQKELQAGDVVWINRINYRNSAGELIMNDAGIRLTLKK